jgi:dihydrofolate reductase
VAKLIYSAIASLDGYVEDGEGHFDWGTPDEEVHAFVNDLQRRVGTYLFGRRMYETMLYWETVPVDESVPDFVREFTNTWRASEKVVYSHTLGSVSSARTRIEPNFEPEAIRRLKETESRDLAVGGADLAGQAIRAGLVDELQRFVVPVVVGGGKPWLPTGLHLDLELLETCRFSCGFVFLRYRVPQPT